MATKKKAKKKKVVKKATKKVSNKKSVNKKPVKKNSSTKKSKKKTILKKSKKKVAKKTSPKRKKVTKKVIKKALAKKYSNKKSNTQTKKVKTVTSFKKVVWSEFFTPLDDRLVVKVVEKTNKTAGGIYIPDSVVEAAPNKGTVVAVGQGHKSSKGHLRPMDVKVGDEILFSEFAGSQMILFDEAVLILREQDVLGIVE